MPSPKQTLRLSAPAVSAAAEVVAQNCRTKSQPFTVVFHGGGEPTLDLPFAEEILDSVEAVARAFDLTMFRYIATNGVMSRQKGLRVARRFDLIGLSCDGPDDIQNAHRPRWGEGETTSAVENTARAVHEAGKTLHVRVTVTNDSVERQGEIARYVCEQLRPAEIHVEPMYRIGRAGDDDGLTGAQRFVEAFWEARAIAQSYGVNWLTSGSRPNEIHASYCNLFRDVVQLVPGDAATACFKTSNAVETQHQGFLIGKYDKGQGFVLDAERLNTMREGLAEEPAECQGCFNRFHCVRGCPEYCPMQKTWQKDSFRCQVQQLLTGAYLQEAAANLRPMWLMDGMAGTAIDTRM